MTSCVAVLKTSPETVIEDYSRLLDLAGLDQALDPARETILKINVSWHVYYPACSTTPWQLEGVIAHLIKKGFPASRLIAAHNRTVVVSDRVGEVNNKLRPILDKYGVRTVYLNEPGVEWVPYRPRRPFRVLDRIFPDGVKIPALFIGKNIIHLPTMKTHVFTTITGAMKNAFGGLLSERRHWTHAVIDETLVDLLQIQREIHSGLFAVTDGTISGDGPGPRAMIPHITNYILASADQVAIDSVAARMMGFNPLSLPFIRIAQEAGFGCGDPSAIPMAGDDVSGVDFHFRVADTFASRGQKTIYHGSLKRFENFLLRTPLVPWSYAASRLYHDVYWYPCRGKKRVQAIMNTGWGRLFQKY
jgi:uncharacterized protein (DUF362 family)